MKWKINFRIGHLDSFKVNIIDIGQPYKLRVRSSDFSG